VIPQKHADAEAEFELCRVTYEALAEGFPILDVGEIIRTIGLDGDGWPALAIARADRREVMCFKHGGSVWFDGRGGKLASRWNRRYPTLIHQIRWPEIGTTWAERYALVPMVPADVRPEKGRLKDWHILWEVDEWSKQSKFATAPADPFLLKHLAGNLFAVIAMWELTAAEQKVLEILREVS
jgi:hypothetical protein